MDFSGSGDVTGEHRARRPRPAARPDAVVEHQRLRGRGLHRASRRARWRSSSAARARSARRRRTPKTAGASAVVIFNEGQPGRTEALAGTLGDPIDIPVIGTSFDVGNELADLAEAGDMTVHITTSTLSETRTTYNVIADAPSGRTDHTVVVGSHLDSVSPARASTTTAPAPRRTSRSALQYAKAVKNPSNHVRFLFFGAEEEGLLGLGGLRRDRSRRTRPTRSWRCSTST